MPVHHGEALGFGFPDIQTRLPETGGLLRVHSGPQIGSLQEVAPARELIFSALFTLEVLNRHLGLPASFDYGHDATGLISPQVISDDGKRCYGFVPHQKLFRPGRPRLCPRNNCVWMVPLPSLFASREHLPLGFEPVLFRGAILTTAQLIKLVRPLAYLIL